MIVVAGAAQSEPSTLSEPAPPAKTAPRVVNVTSDSAAGWLPSEALEAEARRSVLDYLAAKDAGKGEAAYAALSNSMKAMQSATDFTTRHSDFNRRAGAVEARRLVVLPWTKDPANAPGPESIWRST